ncbi:hypothetical protein ES288_A02G060400v1 [Gossypium darwinii]|uniref:Bidirectional sugar transporter SWEET n=1 Tax=Gossypium darwinii TaxID=34276 RepID=A0A5D2HBK2_GOSDA|nr:hypothetical protein ES288_A02G060400v1 [Gossypium darwinii]
MEILSLSFFVGIIGNVISVLVFLSPIGTFERIIKHKSTEDFQSLPYICTLLNSSLWTYYGITKPGGLLVATVNGFGIFVEAVYLKTGVLVGILNVGFVAAAIVVTQLALESETQIGAIGLMCSGLNIIMYGSPLAAMKTVVTTKSVEYMPFFLSFFLFLNGGIWAFYASLMHDYFLGVPNGIGCLLGTAQLLLYAIYKNAKPSNNTSLQGLMEQGWQKEPLISQC